MPAANAIKAGEAFVRAFLDSTDVDKGLVMLRAKIVSWQASLSKLTSATMGGAQLPGPIGALLQFAASPAGVFSGLITAATLTAKMGEDMMAMSQRVGISVERMSELAYAAKQVKVESTDLITGIKNMERTLETAARGSVSLLLQLSRYGIKIKELQKLRPDEQFRSLAESISKIANPTERGAAAIAVFGRWGTQLMPLLLQGAAGLDAWTQRARDLGVVIDEKTARSGREFMQIMRDLWEVTMASVRVIGGALLPTLTGFMNAGINITNMVRRWLESHRGLIQGILIGTGAFVAFGLAVKVLSMAFGVAAQAVQLFKFALDTVLLIPRMAFAAVAMVAGAAWAAAAYVVETAWSIAARVTTAAWDAFVNVAKMAGMALRGIFAVAGFVTQIGLILLTGAAWQVAAGEATAAWAAFYAFMAGAILTLQGFVLGLGVLWVTGVFGLIGSALGMVSSAIAGISTGVATLIQKLSNMGRSMGDFFSGSFASSAMTAFSMVSRMVGIAADKIARDWRAGLNQVIADSQAAGSIIMDAIQVGDWAGALNVAIALLEKEWLTFSAWLKALWVDLKPSWNTAIDVAANRIGQVTESAMNAWDSIWNAAIEGMRTFLTALNKALNGLMSQLAAVYALVASLPGGAAFGNMSDKERDKRRTMPGMEKWAASPALQSMLPAAETDEDKAAAKKKNKAAGAAAAGAVGGMKGDTSVWGMINDFLGKALDSQKVRDADDALQKAIKDQGAVNKDLKAKQALPPGANGKDFEPLPIQEGRHAAGTFSGAAAAMMGGGGDPVVMKLDEIKRVLEIGPKDQERIHNELKRHGAIQKAQQVEVLRGLA